MAEFVQIGSSAPAPRREHFIALHSGDGGSTLLNLSGTQ